MAIQSTLYDTTGGDNRFFSSTKPILSKSNVAVWFLMEIDNLWHVQSAENYELINNVIVFPDDVKGITTVEIRVADEPNELLANKDDIAIVAGIEQEIRTVAGIEQEVIDVAGIKGHVQTVSLLAPEVFEVGTDLAKGIGTNQPTDSAILNALTNARAAEDHAFDAQLDAWISEAEAMTSQSNASQPEFEFTREYTSNGDGTFRYVETTDYSAYHWAKNITAIKHVEVIDANAGDKILDTTRLVQNAGTYVNGILLIENEDYVLTGPKQVTFVQPLHQDDKVILVTGSPTDLAPDQVTYVDAVTFLPNLSPSLVTVVVRDVDKSGRGGVYSFDPTLDPLINDGFNNFNGRYPMVNSNSGAVDLVSGQSPQLPDPLKRKDSNLVFNVDNAWREIFYFEAGSYHSFLSWKEIEEAIARASLFQGNTGNTAGTGLIGYDSLPVPNDNIIDPNLPSNKGFYWVVGETEQITSIANVPLSVPLDLEAGWWLQSAGDPSVGFNGYQVIKTDILTKNRADALYSLTPWNSGEWEANSLVLQSGMEFKANQHVPANSIEPDIDATGTYWDRIQIPVIGFFPSFLRKITGDLNMVHLINNTVGLEVWDGLSWREVAVNNFSLVLDADVPTVDGVDGDTLFTTDTEEMYFYGNGVWRKTTIDARKQVTVGAILPTTDLVEADLFVDEITGVLHGYYDNGTAVGWYPIGSAFSSNVGSGAPTVSANDIAGDKYYDSSERRTWTYDGSAWQYTPMLKANATFPGSRRVGDLWNNETNKQLIIKGVSNDHRVVKSSPVDANGVGHSHGISNIVVAGRGNYNNIGTKDPQTLYFIYN